ncbi:MAG: MBL fold metallo-hydrolase [Leptospiraceae bacterium]|nr:MBL fold metallo-hydrolase [Leptospiraceae bacterium]MDW7975572.1 MBL fold metallo-hydrolase [Leptospiraceae bacterium]
MKIRFWGVRGSIPSPIKGHMIKSKIKKVLSLAKPSDILDEKSIENFINSLPFSMVSTYGGNTTCIEVRTSKNEILIIDGGTGMRELGQSLMNEGFRHGKGIAHILMTHSHWDHIQGIPFFEPLYVKGNIFHFHGIHPDIEERLRYQNHFEHFPVSFDQMQATKYFHIHKEGEVFQIYDLKINSKALRHPGISYAYKIQENDKIFVFSSDAEFRFDNKDLDSYIEFFSDADVLVFDTQYTLDEQLLMKIDWGHSSANIATDLALKANVKNLILFHHDPSYNDEMIDQVYQKAIKYKDIVDYDNSHSLQIFIAYESFELDL